MAGDEETSVRGVLVAVVIGLAVCGCTEGERRLPTPEFQPRQAIPGIDRQERNASDDGERSRFEEAIRESQSDGEESEGETSSRQLVPLGSGFAGEIPVEFDAWQWAADATSTLVVYAETGGRPQAVVYAEDFSDFGQTSPSLELDRFLVAVDPGFHRSVTVPQAIGDGLGDFASDFEAPAAEMLSGVLRGSSRTLGLGLRYRSRPDSFTGWRWIGDNEQGVTLRAARTKGRFGLAASPGPETSSMFGRLQSKVDGMGRAQSSLPDLRESLSSTGASDGAGRGVPGWMLVAQVEAEASRALHLAVACERPCPVASELARLLGSIRLRTEAEGRLSGASSGSLVDLAHEHGFPLVASDAVPTLGDSIRELTGGTVGEAPGSTGGAAGGAGGANEGSGPVERVPGSESLKKSLQKLKDL